MANSPRYYPPGIPRSDPLVRLYDIVYGLQSQITAANNASANNNSSSSASTPSSSNPMTTRGDMIYGNNNGVPSRLPATGNNTILQTVAEIASGNITQAPTFVNFPFTSQSNFNWANNTVYPNNTNRAQYYNLVGVISAAATCQVFCDANSSPATNVFSLQSLASGNNNQEVTAGFFVPPGYNWKILHATPVGGIQWT